MSQFHVIVGLGITGLSCARFLHQQHIPFAVIDTRANPPNVDDLKKISPDIETSFGKIDDALLAKADVIVLSPGIPVYEPHIAAEAKRGIPVIGDIELFAQAARAPVIAITGTNAKSTVTTLVGLMLKAAGLKVEVGGNLGVPALDLLMRNPDAEVFVLELSSFQLETTYSLHARVATVLNVTPDHMDRYENLAAYQAAKHRIYENCELAVCNRDDPLTYTNSAPTLYFTLKTPQTNEFGLLEQDQQMYLAFEHQLLIATRELPVAGKHYQANALAALAMGYGFGLDFEPMLKVLREFKGLPHRCQLVRERNQVKWYNDSKGTNVGATQAAIEGLGKEISGKLILIAGGVGKNAEFTPLIPAIQKYVRHVVLIGEVKNELAEIFSAHVPVSFADSMDDAVKQSEQAALPGDSVLLSPACASFDMFKHFEHRGEVFTESVEKL